MSEGITVIKSHGLDTSSGNNGTPSGRMLSVSLQARGGDTANWNANPSARAE
jgi:hypothetical protein